MKNSTKLLALAGALSVGLSAQAEATFNRSENIFPDTHRTGAYIGDFTNNDKMDVFYRGQYNRSFEKPGIWSWTSQAVFLFNQGDDQWNIDGLTAVQNDEPNTDENGNPVIGEDGNPVYNYHLEGNKHGVRCGSYDQSAAIDYNNDGLLDLIVFGEDGSDNWFNDGDLKKNHLSLYRNNGDGTFTMEEKAQFPICKPQKSFKSNAIAVGDYDRDGYADFMISGYQTDGWEDDTLGPDLTVLYHNNGDGSFTRMDIAETINGVFSWTVKDDEGNVAVEPRKLEGWFRPIAGNVFFADLNNDGWLDIITTGVAGEYENWWTGDRLNSVNDRENVAAVYINNQGEKFVEITPELFYNLRNGSGAVNDFDGDGYLDFFHIGWGDNGYNWNAFLYTNTAADDVFDFASDCNDLGVWGDEDKRIHVRDFDGDGNLDILYSNKDNKISICYGSMSGSFSQKQHDEYFSTNVAAVADLNGDGMSDMYYSGDWGDEYFSGVIYYNTSATPEAPAAPANVAAEYKDGKVVVTWDDVDGDAENHLAYNVYIKNAEGDLYCVIPANPETGFIKVSNERSSAIRPFVGEYSITAPEGSYTVGVQTLSLANETYSAFTTAAVAGLEETLANKAAAFGVTVDSEGVMVAGNGEEVKIVNALGQTVATGVAGQHINVAANGVLIVVKGNETAKVVK